MSVNVSGQPLPQGIGRVTPGWLAVVGAAAAALAVGLYAYSREASEGLIETGLGDPGTGRGVAWGLYVAFVVYFVGVSFAGITIAALIRLFRIERLQGIARIAELLTVVALLLAALSILVDLGQPLRGIVNLFLYARPQSPFFGTFTLVISGYLFASIVYLYLDGRHDAAICARVPSRLQWFHRLWAAGYRDTPAERERHRRTTVWLAIAIIPLLVVAHSTLGFVFGLQVGRPGWYSALQAPAFVVLAGVSGLGLLIVIAAFMRRVGVARERLDEAVFSLLGRFLMVLLIAYLYFMVAELLTSTYAGSHHEQLITQALLSGEYSTIFWASVGLLVLALGLMVWQAVTHRWSIAALVAAGLFVNVAAVGKRYLIVVPSQTQGQLLPYVPGSYAPTLGEYAVVVGLFGLGVLLFALFMKVFPIVELPEEEVPAGA
ncbi:MAG TPA: NrfD/PsrC family molybdoenzyme membrane anchor subunit [Candidatus Limnocylindrales bacterium]|nr:NrfD/PsrC family molybdoenzyme membrane anchor subunit [Candidatus Limnocylindrales bacterium]HLE78772.1 NrfD/PsrC family molybdoenzyme membrane anchor subunit [Candidatus Limnocylindrales bacterium]